MPNPHQGPGEYLGMRWFKTDFQVQTPEDNRHWADDELRLSTPRRPNRSEADLQAKAQRFLARCHALELDVIGITDHNFSEKTDPRDWFLTHVVEQNKTVARDCGRAPLYILPGFEVDIGYHVLCLFNPARKVSHLRRVNMILSKLGLAEHERFRNGIPTPLRIRGETVSLKTLLEVVQGEHAGIVIAAHADQQDGLLSSPRNIDDYQLSGLYAVELTGYPMADRYRTILHGRSREWSRPGRQPAYVQSSDAKSLQVQADGTPGPNALGYRYTWVKSSQPSIASLRQAFLDGQSRLRLQPERPSDTQTHPRIAFLKCRGLKFVADQELHFSPNLNTVIGGRGTGKSTLLELLRFAFGRDQGEGFSTSLQAKFERVRATYTDDVEIQVGWEGLSGQLDIIGLTPRQGLRLIQGDAEDVAIFLRQLPVQFYSQQELSELTDVDRGNGLLTMIDEACAAELQGLKGQEDTLRAELQQLFSAADHLRALNEEVKVLNQEIRELERQWQARREVQQEAMQFQHAEAARRYGLGIQAQLLDDMAQFSALAERLSSSGAFNDGRVETWPRAPWFNALTQQALDLRAGYQLQVGALVQQFQADIDKLFGGEPGWETIIADLDHCKAAFLQACTDRGLQPQDVARIQEIDRTRQAKIQALQEKQRRLQDLEQQRGRLTEALSALNALWREQYGVRVRATEEITAKASGSVRVVVNYMADEDGFLGAWERMAPDRRGKLGRIWDDLGEQFFADYQHYLAVDSDHLDSPWAHIREVLAGNRAPPGRMVELVADLKTYFNEHQQLWRVARVTRVEERVDVELFRADGSLVGSVEGHTLSEGQRNTALLHLLLAKGEGPIVIDQPEDELDSNFIYRELVPLLRKVKNQRQIIVATHNANLPVNADTDLVYALSVSEGHGVPLAVGGLDRAETATAVLEIMEGSAEAFQRRLDKYHF